MKKFGIIGPGAVGTAITFALTQSKLDVTLFGRSNATVYFQEYNQDVQHSFPVQSLEDAHEK